MMGQGRLMVGRAALPEHSTNKGCGTLLVPPCVSLLCALYLASNLLRQAAYMEQHLPPTALPGCRADAKPSGFDDRPRREFDDERPSRRGFGDRWGPEDRDRPRDGSQDGGAPRDRPRLNLAPRSKPVEGGPPAPAAGASRSSVFGAARPREEVLREQGRDPVKEEEAREAHQGPAAGPAVDRPESQEEQQLKQQIVDLRVRLTAGEGDAQVDGHGDEAEGSEGCQTVAAALQQLEAQLDRLQLELDEKTGAEHGGAGGGEREGGRRGPPSGGEREGWRRGGEPADRTHEGRGGFWGGDRGGERESFRDRDRGGGGERDSFRGRDDRGRDSFRGRDERAPSYHREGSQDRPSRQGGGW